MVLCTSQSREHLLGVCRPGLGDLKCCLRAETLVWSRPSRELKCVSSGKVDRDGAQSRIRDFTGNRRQKGLSHQPLVSK